MKARSLLGFPWLFGCLVLLAGGSASAQDARAKSCEQLWLDESGPYVNRAKPDYASLLKYWKTQEKKCGGTVLYEARLALLHVYLRDAALARKILAGIKDTESPYYKDVEFLSISIDMVEADGQPAAEQLATLKRVRTRLEGFTKRNPQSAEGFNMLGSVLTLQREYEYALRVLENAKRVASPQVSKWGLYRNLAVVYSHLKRYREAIASADEALSYTTSLQADGEFMSARIRSYAALDKFEQASETEKIFRARNPAAMNDPEFKAAVRYFHQRIEVSKAPADKAP